jgi:hypothetical protein
MLSSLCELILGRVVTTFGAHERHNEANDAWAEAHVLGALVGSLVESVEERLKRCKRRAGLPLLSAVLNNGKSKADVMGSLL